MHPTKDWIHDPQRMGRLTENFPHPLRGVVPDGETVDRSKSLVRTVPHPAIPSTRSLSKGNGSGSIFQLEPGSGSFYSPFEIRTDTSSLRTVLLKFSSDRASVPLQKGRPGGDFRRISPEGDLDRRGSTTERRCTARPCHARAPLSHALWRRSSPQERVLHLQRTCAIGRTSIAAKQTCSRPRQGVWKTSRHSWKSMTASKETVLACPGINLSSVRK